MAELFIFDLQPSNKKKSPVAVGNISLIPNYEFNIPNYIQISFLPSSARAMGIFVGIFKVAADGIP